VTTVIVLMLLILAPLAWDKLDQRARRRDREIMRRLHRYMAQLPPARPW